jgi:hypothetical protein
MKHAPHRTIVPSHLTAPNPRLSRGLAAAVLAAVAALAPVAAIAGEATKELRLTIDPAAGAFMVENLAGTMRVVPGPGAEVVAVATVRAESRDLADAVRFEKVTDEKTALPTLRVRYPLDRHSTIRHPHDGSGIGGDNWLTRLFGSASGSRTTYDGHKVRVSSGSGVLLYADVEVKVPERPGLRATFRNRFGLLEGSGVRGELTFDTDAGDVRLDKVGGEVRADTGSGTVRATAVEGSFLCDTGSGDCLLTDFKGDLIDCDVGSGDVTVRNATARKVRVDTGSGDVRLVEADIETFEADTGSGNVRLENRGTRLRHVHADTGSGDVSLRLGSAASFEAFADQGSGDLVVRYADATPIVKGREVLGYRRGDGRVRISVDTGSGDLVIEP